MSPQALKRKADRQRARRQWPQRKASPEYAAANLQSTKTWRQKNPEKRAAQAAVYRAIKSGRLVRPELCERCHKAPPRLAHHESYAPEDWLLVDFLCLACHGIVHRKGEP